MPEALLTLCHEHRTISAILHGMEHLVREIRVHGKRIDPRVFHAMIYYLDTYSERHHHPNEEKYIFGILRQRDERAARIIARLEADHADGEAALRRLAQAVIRYEEGGASELEAFAREVSNFVDAYRDHMRREEEELFPRAQEVLTPLDWAMIDGAIEETDDPLAAAAQESNFERLFERIVSLAPPPIGLGAAPAQARQS